MLAILDIDGTLVDTNDHHALAWYRAFRRHDITWAATSSSRPLTDDDTERELGDAIRDAEQKLYFELIDAAATMDGARTLIEELRERGHAVVLASSAKADEVDRYLLDVRDMADGWTTSADVKATKPQPDLVRAALDRVGAAPKDAIMVGDTPWDVRAAQRARVSTIAVLTGGFSAHELHDAGALSVFESVRELCTQLPHAALR
jgi:HAD superfamily hydrolase (TIGR01509 family)